MTRGGNWRFGLGRRGIEAFMNGFGAIWRVGMLYNFWQRLMLRGRWDELGVEDVKRLLRFLRLWRELLLSCWLRFFCWPVVQTVPVKVESQSHGATIVLSNGEEVRLGDTVLNHRLREANIDVANGEIKVQATNVETKVESKVIAYNTLKVPHGESYSITLADGTRVWVNALSSLKFPSSFEGSAERIVELVGEGFFEVARDTVHPFRVKTVNQTIVVTGTAFNVEAYVGEVSRTTLCQGQVIVEASVGKPVFLSPGQQLSVDKQGEVVVAEVNTDVYTSWIRGEYYFDNQTLDQVLLELGKWFEIKEVIFFDPALERQLFSGKFKKSDGLETILKVIERGSWSGN